jgi:hypothetical protein
MAYKAYAAAPADEIAPTLKKARAEELTRHEIEMALRELGSLNGGAPPSLHVEFRGHRFWSSIVWGGTIGIHWYDSLEDALVAECDRVLGSLGEEDTHP